MAKYPLVEGMAGFGKLLGWISILGGGGSLIVGILMLVYTQQPTYIHYDPTLGFKAIALLIIGAVLLFGGTFLVTVAEIAHVFIDTALNTGETLELLQRQFVGDPATQRSELSAPQKVEARDIPIASTPVKSGSSSDFTNSALADRVKKLAVSKGYRVDLQEPQRISFRRGYETHWCYSTTDLESWLRRLQDEPDAQDLRVLRVEGALRPSVKAPT